MGAPPGESLVILDLNGTILDSSRTLRPGVQPDGKARFKHVYFRPHLKEFIEYLFANFRHVAVWTSNIPANATALVDLAFGPVFAPRLLFVFHREHCLLGPNYSSQKPLESVWRAYPQYGCHNTYIIDDSKEKMTGSATNCHLMIPTFEASPQAVQEDFELKRIVQGLQ